VSKVKKIKTFNTVFMDKKEKFDYEALKKRTLEQLRSGKSLFGKDGAFAPLLKDILEAAMEGELENHLDEEERATGNRKNGKTSKKLKTADGTIDLETPRDRAASFEPQIVRKRETILAESLESKIIGLYSHGMSLRNISAHIKEMYDTEISAATLSAITDKVIPLVKE
jgi:putative transposase